MTENFEIQYLYIAMVTMLLLMDSFHIYNVIDEQIWIDCKRVYKKNGYSLTCGCDLNNSNDKSSEKTTIIYNNDDKFFNI